MKKTLMALSLALCATLAFAQMPKSARVLQATKAVESNVSASMSDIEMQRQESFKGSIFTKAPLFTETFSSTSQTYQVDQKLGTGYQSAPYSRFQRVPDTTASAVSGMATQFPVLFGPTSRYGFKSLSGFDAPTCRDGFMVMSMQDQIGAWGGSGTLGSFDSWIDFKGVQPVAGKTYDVSLYQYYRRFNAVDDSTILEYSQDSSTWGRIYFNRASIDLQSNASTLGMKTIALPAAVANYTNLYIRIRYKSDSNVGDAYGYYWMLDDVSIDTASRNRFNISSRQFYDGGYHLVPQGMGGRSLMWMARFRNTSAFNQTNVRAEVMHGTTLLAQSDVANLLVPDALNDTFARIDIEDRLASFFDGGPNTYGTSNPLPFTTMGEDSIFVNFISDSLTYNLDTIKFLVNGDTANGNYIWGRDNGYLSGQSRWYHGLSTSDGLWTTPENNGCDLGEQGYSVCVRYFTPATVPSGWVIRGVEIVPSTYDQYVQAGAKIDGVLYYDTAGSQPNTISWVGISTNAATYTVQSSDIDPFSFGYKKFGNYPTIRINFLSQPRLKPNQNYWVGYQMAEAGIFLPAVDRSYYYDQSDSLSHPLPNHWNRRFTLGSYGNAFVFQPSAPQGKRIGWAGGIGQNTTPMIRMIVGPERQIPNHNITWNARPLNGGTVFDYSSQQQVLGQTTPYPEGGTVTFAIEPEPDYDLDSLYVDGTPIDIYYGSDPNFQAHSGFYTYTFTNLQTDHSCVAVFAGQGINKAENAVIKVQPNPATSEAYLTIEGVNGNVNYALIDINGRVISQKVINANATEQISLNGLARGTYFVRVTNNNFTKVEKLIVR